MKPREYRGWAICDRKRKPYTHSIRKAKRDVLFYAKKWCNGPESWRKISKDAGYTIRRITITVE